MLLTVEQLSFRYPRSSNDALHELSFSIAEGEIFGFLGPSGAGKSTTQKILYKLLQGYRGEVTFAGKTLGNWGRDFYEQIGVSFELPNHYLKLTAEENLRFFGRLYGLEALDAQVERQGKVVGRADALNDVVVNSGTSAQMIEFELHINDSFVYRQRADGLIVSTPTGSTAYSLSGGGPIMHPTLDAIVLVPMFPHALSSRPIVVEGNSEIRVDILARNRIHPPVTCDGQVNMTARPGDSVHVRKKAHKLTLLHPLGHSFYASCRDKLRWGDALVS